ncbi:MAG: pyrroline-5-carboxylate reductase [Planctomycetota bacterium]|nr:MAG: pyrroline-5-carboxylate reductase [Planctomycetota bacterium]
MNKIGFIGGGNMAQAIITGILKGSESFEILVFEPSADRQIQLKEEFKEITFVENNRDLIKQNCDAIILAVKPQILPLVLEEIKPKSDNQILVSIAAGVTVETIKSYCPQAKVVRVMPNTPFLVMEGCGGITFDSSLNQTEKDLVLNIFESSGQLIEVPESKMHIITALSGSGPAYIFKIAENMIQAGIDYGLTLEEAKLLSAQTITGAGILLKSSDLSAEQLRINVTSPNGTTEAALNKMDQLNLNTAIQEGIKAAVNRSNELANN